MLRFHYATAPLSVPLYTGRDLYIYGGWDGHAAHNSLHKLHIDTLTWKEMAAGDVDELPMKMSGCGLVAFGNEQLVLFGGYGIPSTTKRSSKRSNKKVNLITTSSRQSSLASRQSSVDDGGVKLLKVNFKSDLVDDVVINNEGALLNEMAEAMAEAGTGCKGLLNGEIGKDGTGEEEGGRKGGEEKEMEENGGEGQQQVTGKEEGRDGEEEAKKEEGEQGKGGEVKVKDGEEEKAEKEEGKQGREGEVKGKEGEEEEAKKEGEQEKEEAVKTEGKDGEEEEEQRGDREVNGKELKEQEEEGAKAAKEGVSALTEEQKDPEVSRKEKAEEGAKAAEDEGVSDLIDKRWTNELKLYNLQSCEGTRELRFVAIVSPFVPIVPHLYLLFPICTYCSPFVPIVPH